MTTDTITPIVDEDFRRLIQPLTAEEYAGLEASLLAEGCRDPLVVWRDEGVLLDGHHRLTICQTHGIKYQTHEIAFDSRDEAKRWIIE